MVSCREFGVTATLPPPYRHPTAPRVSGCFRYEIGHSATLATLATLFPRSFFLSRKSVWWWSLARATRVHAREAL